MMSQQPLTVDSNAPHTLTLNLQSLNLTDEQFVQLCRDNRDLRIEMTAKGELIIMPPTGSRTGWRNSKLNQRLANWADEDGTGLCFDSSTGFTLPDGAKLSPDAAWIRRERWEALSEKEQEGFAPLCPDFAVERRSANDTLSELQDKMSEYIENTARLGWLIDPQSKRVYIYRAQQQEVECLENPKEISGETVLPGFVLNVWELW
jgi:Uma2 family endonuclease